MIKIPKNCELCGQTLFSSIYSARQLVGKQLLQVNLRQCKICGLVSLDPKSEVKLDVLYPSSYPYYSLLDDHYGKRTNKLQGQYGKICRKAIQSLLVSEPKILSRVLYLLIALFSQSKYGGVPISRASGKILDVGCADGYFLSLFNGTGWEGYGVDISKEAITRGRKYGLRVVCGTIKQAGYPASYFDVVRICQVLEHVPSPTETLNEINRVLKPNGTLYLVVPNYNGLTTVLLGKVMGNKGNVWDVPRHIYQFTPRTISNFLWKAGFAITSIKTAPGAQMTGVLRDFLNRNNLSGVALILYLLDELLEMPLNWWLKGALLEVRAVKVC